MRQKTLLLAIIGTILLVTAGVVGAMTVGAGPTPESQSTDSGKSIIVSATGEIKATPDQAVVRVAVTATGTDANAVRKELAVDAAMLRDALAEYGITDAQIRTAYFHIFERHIRTPKQMETGKVQYRGTHAFSITVNDTSAVGEVIDIAVQNGADRVMGVTFTLSEEKRDHIYNLALREAMENAENRAQTLADAGNLSITGVYTIVETNSYYTPYRVAVASAKASGDAGTSIDSGPVTVSASVSVTYNATAA